MQPTILLFFHTYRSTILPPSQTYFDQFSTLIQVFAKRHRRTVCHRWLFTSGLFTPDPRSAATIVPIPESPVRGCSTSTMPGPPTSTGSSRSCWRASMVCRHPVTIVIFTYNQRNARRHRTVITMLVQGKPDDPLVVVHPGTSTPADQVRRPGRVRRSVPTIREPRSTPEEQRSR